MNNNFHYFLAGSILDIDPQCYVVSVFHGLSSFLQVVLANEYRSL